MNHLQTSLLDVLDQGFYLLEAVDDDVYANKMPEAFGASIGEHYRHCLDHFQSLVRGLDGEIDYDDRMRDKRIETDRAFARLQTEKLLHTCRNIGDDAMSAEVRVRCKACYTDEESPLVSSTVGREAMYTVVHAVHHYALISVMCQSIGVQLDETFGVAPSTAQHLRGGCADIAVTSPS